MVEVTTKCTDIVIGNDEIHYKVQEDLPREGAMRLSF
jgi:hypothetical protein